VRSLSLKGSATTGARLVWVLERVAPAKGVASYATPKQTSRSFLVRGSDGDEFGFDCNTIRENERLGNVRREVAGRRNIPWEVVKQGP
jgi:hypothetical protein